jgi:ABC-type sugar transport system ATPase subunit
VLISSSEDEELLALADRIYVFYEGKIVEELTGDRRTEENLISAMLGVNYSQI